MRRILLFVWLAGWGVAVWAEDHPANVKPGGRAARGPGQKAEKRTGDRSAALAPPSAFYPILPCRLVDTRVGEGKSGAFGPPLLAAGSSRSIPIPLSNCGIPAGATGYSLNVTVVPRGRLSFLTAYPTGQSLPNVSTLNSFDGAVTANAAVVPAGFNGAIDIYASDDTEVVIDVNGYFGGGSEAIRFYVVSPCRVMDTRTDGGKSGPFGPPSMAAGGTRNVPMPLSGCGMPPTARAYIVNVTVIPKGRLSYLVAWPQGQTRPLASTLNSQNGRVVANAAIVPAGSAGGISVFVTDETDVVMDVSGYLAP